MSDTKALDEVIDFYHSMNDTDEDPDAVAVADQAAAELAQLRAENAQLADDNKRLTDSILALRGEMVLVRKMWKETIDHNAQLRADLDEARKVIMDLMGVLPDSTHIDKCWDWAWDELDGDAQEAVKEKRSIASDWLAAHPEESK